MVLSNAYEQALASHFAQLATNGLYKLGSQTSTCQDWREQIGPKMCLPSSDRMFCVLLGVLIMTAKPNNLGEAVLLKGTNIELDNNRLGRRK